jgi:hypothetical protein
LGDDQLTTAQRDLVTRPITGEATFLQGPAGSGKTTVGVARLRHLLSEGIPADAVLVLTPQRTLLTPYLRLLRSADRPPGSSVNTLTIAGLARRMVDLFWPLVASQAGFAHPDRPPVFLTLETAQFYMARIADPMIEEGAFDEVTIDRNRLLSQILDNLNKAALVGLDYTQVGQRLREAWTGPSARAAVYDRAQDAANRFRAYCLERNLLDFSLQIEVFVRHLLTLPWPPGEGFMNRFTRYRHLIVDNLEEDVPVTHDLLRAWLPTCESALLIYDQDAGYRLFLGADPEGALRLRQVCQQRAELHDSFVTTPHLRRMGHELARGLRQASPPLDDETGRVGEALVASEDPLRFHTQMLDWVTAEIAQLVFEDGVAPGEIVVVAPFLSDALRFSLSERLEHLDIPSQSHRPSRALREEPAARCLLTLTALAHPEWGHAPPAADVVHALALAIDGLDPVRARLLANIVYRPQNIVNGTQEGQPESSGVGLNPFADLKTSVQERIGYQVGNRYDALRNWLYRGLTSHTSAAATHDAGEADEDRHTAIDPRGNEGKVARTSPPLDHFLSRLFGELLSQPGYGFHADFDAGRVSAQLIASALKFRQVFDEPEGESAPPSGLEYVRMVERGVIAAQYVPAWGTALEEEEAVLLAPAYTFLMRNRPVDYQFWLSVGSSGWWERLSQPLTHPYVLTRHWPPGQLWTDADEVKTRTEALHRLVQGLVRRCRKKIYLGISELGEQGFEQRGPLLQAIQGALRRQSRREQNSRG